MKDKLTTLVFSGLTIFITFLLILYPDQSLDASIRGLGIWWEIVFPSLLPFFITAELLIGFGVVTFIGVLFEPIMRPLFKVPGAGSFAWIMGMASGYPSGAKITVRLRQERELTQIEAERLLSFTNASSPLFIFGAVAIGFFHNPKLGIFIALCHYLGNAFVGICMRFHGQKEQAKNTFVKKHRVSYLKRAFRSMHQTRMKDHQPLGQLIGDAVLHSVTTLVVVGGFIILFSVLNKLLYLVGITTLLASAINIFLYLFSIPIELSVPLISGLFEITLGSQMASQVKIDSLLPKLIIVSFILGFNGFSVQAQVLSIISQTDIRFYPYFIGRLLHGFIACLLTFLLYKPFYLEYLTRQTGDIPVINDGSYYYLQTLFDTLRQIGPFITIISLFLTICILLSRQKSILK